jgi:UPF0042 nucleotide-binding protein
MSELVIITGLSGAGRTTAGRVLEDLGWVLLDGIPAQLVGKLADLVLAPGSAHDRVAIGVVGSRQSEELREELISLRRAGHRLRVLYLEATEHVLVRRYESSRRPHPFSAGTDMSLVDAIASERESLLALRADADIIIDSGSLNVHQLRDRLLDIFATDAPESGMLVRVMSFGFTHGLPIDVDLVIDCRFLPNPHWVEELRPLTGLDPAVSEYVLGQSVVPAFLERLERLLALLMPLYVVEGKSYLSIAFGCTGGRHRSVAIAEQVASALRRLGYEPTVTHRDISQ